MGKAGGRFGYSRSSGFVLFVFAVLFPFNHSLPCRFAHGTGWKADGFFCELLMGFHGWIVRAV